MCDLVKSETERIDSRFLEPACGDGNFLAEILSRKLACEQIRKYRKSSYDWERNSLLALGSLYGVDILADNCEACRERLYGLWEEEYHKVCKKECNDDIEKPRFTVSATGNIAKQFKGRAGSFVSAVRSHLPWRAVCHAKILSRPCVCRATACGGRTAENRLPTPVTATENARMAVTANAATTDYTTKNS